MFVTPFVARNQYDYDSVMKQAIGRVLRHKQQRAIVVYMFIAARTIEVNILEDRITSPDWHRMSGPTGMQQDMKMVLVLRDGKFQLVDQYSIKDTDERDWRGPSLEGAVSAANKQCDD